MTTEPAQSTTGTEQLFVDLFQNIVLLAASNADYSSTVGMLCAYSCAGKDKMSQRLIDGWIEAACLVVNYATEVIRLNQAIADALGIELLPDKQNSDG